MFDVSVPTAPVIDNASPNMLAVIVAVVLVAVLILLMILLFYVKRSKGKSNIKAK